MDEGVVKPGAAPLNISNKGDGQNQEKKQGQPSVSEPPGGEVGIRSMESDTESVQRGEAMPVPESVLPPESGKEAVFQPETQTTPPSGGIPVGETVRQDGGGKGRGLFFWGIFGIIIISVGLLGYFIVGPLLFPEQKTAEPVTSPTPSNQTIVHHSYFITPADNIAEVRLNSVLSSTITNALQALAATALESGSLEEVPITDNNGNQIPWSAFFGAFFTTLTVDQLTAWFEDDFTASLYFNDDGVWPVYVARVKNGVNLDEVRTSIAALESADLSALYLASPGIGQGFKQGKVNEWPSRYQVFSQSGASLNYVFLSNYLLISTNYEGAKKVAMLLGF